MTSGFEHDPHKFGAYFRRKRFKLAVGHRVKILWTLNAVEQRGWADFAARCAHGCHPMFGTNAGSRKRGPALALLTPCLPCVTPAYETTGCNAASSSSMVVGPSNFAAMFPFLSTTKNHGSLCRCHSTTAGIRVCVDGSL